VFVYVWACMYHTIPWVSSLTSAIANAAAACIVSGEEVGKGPGQESEEEGAEGHDEAHAGQQVEAALPSGASNTAGCIKSGVAVQQATVVRTSRGHAIRSLRGQRLS
jgi:hypothetical protein